MRCKTRKQYIHILSVTFLLFSLNPILFSLTTENSASANALSGMTILSASPADYTLSPLIGESGICLSWHQLYGISDINFYGLHSAFPVKPLILATGIDYLAHQDYRWQNEYLALSIKLSSFRLGATQHLIYEKIEDQSWYTWDNDFALSFQNIRLVSEIRCNNIRTEEKTFTLAAAFNANENSSFAASYSFRPKEKDSYSLATSLTIAKPLIIQSSWQNEPARFGLGLKVLIGKLNLMYAVRTHTELNLTHIVDLGSAW